MSTYIRPWCCLEKRCIPLINFHGLKDIKVAEPGKSIFCWGKLDHEIKFTYDGEEHANDCNFCIYTPLKGVIKTQMNIEDFEILRIGSTRAVEKIQDIISKK